MLQQYFFECFMTANALERQMLLPDEFRSFAHTTNIKVLRPEVALCDGFTVDFVLYGTRSAEQLNIEIKWRSSDFARETNRHEWFDGRQGRGFLVALVDDASIPSVSVIKLDIERFQSWFAEKSRQIIRQTLFRKIALPHGAPSRYWVIYVGSDARPHYSSGHAAGVWAFKDRNPAANIMRMLSGDWVFFVQGDSRPTRMYVCQDEPLPALRTSKHNGVVYDNSAISWSITQLDIVRLDTGYHLNFTSSAPYASFESKAWTANPQPRAKEYTQFIRFSGGSVNGARVPYAWKARTPAGHVLPRGSFPARNLSLKRFVDGVRRAAANRGDAVEISEATAMEVLALLPE